MPKLHPTVAAVTERIMARSEKTRAAYLAQMEAARRSGPARQLHACGNVAHAAAACPAGDKNALLATGAVNVGIVTAYNDMLSAHQPFKTFPDIIKEALREVGAVGQIAGATPAMCDGVTQGQAGMDLSLFSRDVIALSTAVALAHDMFEAGVCLGVCDKIIPGLVIGALRFGHLPFVFAPAGPMTSGLPNEEKARVRREFAEGKVGREELLKAEAASYHGPGTCTFYGTANSNQMLMEVMGLHLPGAAFINPNTELRDMMTAASAKRAAAITRNTDEYTPICDVIDERAIVNAVVGLMATGGSTNHTIHLIAIAAAAGISLNWDDFDELSAVTPLLTRIYPNGLADVNHFHAAGGMGFLVRELLDAGLLHDDVVTIAGGGLRSYTQEPRIENGALSWRDSAGASSDTNVLRPVAEPFQDDGGLRLLDGPIGRAVIKTSAVKLEHRNVTAPAIVFSSQDELIARFKAGELERDFIAVLPFQGPKASGMPELHKLTPTLSVLQARGFKVALVTDGRMSGASGKVPAAIHVSPEAAHGGAIARIQDGDIITLDAGNGLLTVNVDAETLMARAPHVVDLKANAAGVGRELFAMFRANASSAEAGAAIFDLLSVGAGDNVAARPAIETLER